MIWIRSVAFVLQMYLMMALMALVYTPIVAFRREQAFAGIQTYCAWVRYTAKHLAGLDTEIRGTVPEGDVLVCSKHQSFLDIIMLCSVLPRPRFIMKRQMQRMPIVGFYASRIGCIPIDRGRGAVAVNQMMSGVESTEEIPGQLVIFPQGTRVHPGARAKYKIGAAFLYERLDRNCVPVATNVGVFWPKFGVRREPGTAILEFCPPIPPGLSQAKFMGEMERIVESNSDRLMAEAGFDRARQK